MKAGYRSGNGPATPSGAMYSLVGVPGWDPRMISTVRFHRAAEEASHACAARRQAQVAESAVGFARTVSSNRERAAASPNHPSVTARHVAASGIRRRESAEQCLGKGPILAAERDQERGARIACCQSLHGHIGSHGRNRLCDLDGPRSRGALDVRLQFKQPPCRLLGTGRVTNVAEERDRIQLDQGVHGPPVPRVPERIKRRHLIPLAPCEYRDRYPLLA